MPRLTERAHEAVRAVLRPGETAIDATAGNGHDTVFLARLVGPEGTVFALDVQSGALEETARRLRDAGLHNVLLRHGDHADLPALIPVPDHGRIGAVMFNLGYRPGGDKSLTTRPDTTCRAIRAALSLLRPGGVLTVLAYSGHPGGSDETAAVERLLRELPEPQCTVRQTATESGAPSAPRLFTVLKAHPAGEEAPNRQG